MTLELQIILFIVVSLGILWLSRRSIRDRTSHGFCRFFAFEGITVLIIINLERWFHDPFSIRQIISWLLLLTSLYLVFHGVILLHRVGKPTSMRADPQLIGVEKTTRLVTEGIYRYIRHPLYASLLYGTWGVFFKGPSWWGAILAGLVSILVFITARREEAENIRFFGEEYRRYMKGSRMFVPFLF